MNKLWKCETYKMIVIPEGLTAASFSFHDIVPNKWYY